jgi:hypothetical protein
MDARSKKLRDFSALRRGILKANNLFSAGQRSRSSKTNSGRLVMMLFKIRILLVGEERVIALP